MMQYQFVFTVDGRVMATEFSDNNVYSAMEVRGHNFVRMENGRHLREELRGQPVFSGVFGPMYGGPGCVRYETHEAYEILSR